MAAHGKSEEFNSWHKNWEFYEERLEQYFVANGVQDADKFCWVPTNLQDDLQPCGTKEAEFFLKLILSSGFTDEQWDIKCWGKST